ncbi:SRPBCC family protein [Ponticaulis profundi]|uniref:SRPBCC family protein n=1 Tax=Ponticaulis profundi TaxID=2665222 RepID=A0ABW1SEN2_9PROT
MSKQLKTHENVGESYLAGAKGQPSARHTFPFPASVVWNALLDGPTWCEWLPITNVTWTSPEPFSVGTTRTVEIGNEKVEEYFFAWEDGRRMAFSFVKSTLPIKAGVEDYKLVDTENGCELLWSGRFSAFFPLGWMINKQMASSLQKGMPKLEAHIQSNIEKYTTA